LRQPNTTKLAGGSRSLKGQITLVAIPYARVSRYFLDHETTIEPEAGEE
jgi:hypothetical protein